VKSDLVSKGIPLSRIEATGYGENETDSPPTTLPKERMQNRRVELELVFEITN
jgi:outer membrane protein OmpA-like peptidoglycan-associated protein